MSVLLGGSYKEWPKHVGVLSHMWISEFCCAVCWY